MDFGRVAAALSRAKAEPYRAAQAARAVCRGSASSYAEIGVLPRAYPLRTARATWRASSAHSVGS